MSSSKPLTVFAQTLTDLGISSIEDMTSRQNELYSDAVKILKLSLGILFKPSEGEYTTFKSTFRLLSEYVDVNTEDYEKYAKSEGKDLTEEEYAKFIKNFLFFKPYPLLEFPPIPEDEVAIYRSLDISIRVNILPMLLNSLIYSEIIYADDFNLPEDIPTHDEKEYRNLYSTVFDCHLKHLAWKNAGYVTKLARDELDDEIREEYISKLSKSIIRLDYDRIPSNLQIWSKLDFLREVEGICLTGSSICPTYNRNWFPDMTERCFGKEPEPIINKVVREEMSWEDYRDSMPDLDIPVEPGYDLESKVMEILSHLEGHWDIEKKERATGDIYTLFRLNENIPVPEDRNNWFLSNKDVRNIEVYQIPRWKIQTHHISAVRAYICYEEGEMVMYADPGYIYTLRTDNNIALFYIATKKCSGIDVIKKYMDRGITFSPDTEEKVREHYHGLRRRFNISIRN